LFTPPSTGRGLIRSKGLLFLVLLARAAAGQATVRGVVFDSLASAPLGHAAVQLVAADNPTLFGKTIESDSAGHFEFSDVPAGRYSIGFLHPLLDSLGLEPPVREIAVPGTGIVAVSLAIPSRRRLRSAYCDGKGDDEATFVGFVRDSRTRAPVPNATVLVQWIEMTIGGRGGMTQQVAHRTAQSASNGWFALCDIPRMGIISTLASLAADSSGRIDLDVPQTGVLHRDLYVAPSTGAEAVRRLTGVVLATRQKRPIEGAVVSASNGTTARTNERGEWSLDGVPAGTRSVQVRALGFFPERVVVDAVEGEPGVVTALSNIREALDTVHITETRVARNAREFEERRRTGSAGRFLTSEDVLRHHPFQTSDALRQVPGLHIEQDATTGERVMSLRDCRPSVFIDGQFIRDLSADGIDSFVQPDEVAGIEVYAGDLTPVQFRALNADLPAARLSGPAGVTPMGASYCGSIVIWTKRRGSVGSMSWRKRVLTVGAVVGIGAGIGAIVTR
jgi:hypothetical protein